MSLRTILSFIIGGACAFLIDRGIINGDYVECALGLVVFISFIGYMYDVYAVKEEDKTSK